MIIIDPKKTKYTPNTFLPMLKIGLLSLLLKKFWKNEFLLKKSQQRPIPPPVMSPAVLICDFCWSKTQSSIFFLSSTVSKGWRINRCNGLDMGTSSHIRQYSYAMLVSLVSIIWSFDMDRRRCLRNYFVVGLSHYDARAVGDTEGTVDDVFIIFTNKIHNQMSYFVRRDLVINTHLIPMSIVQAVITKILDELRAFSTLPEPQRIQLLRNAHFILGRPFIEALTQLENNPESIKITQEQQFIIVETKLKKQLIFYKKNAQPLGLECTCQAIWDKKTGEKAIIMCKHEVMYLLWKHCFMGDRAKRKRNYGDVADCLLEILDIIST